MKDLKQLIRESINEYIKAIDEAGHKAGMEARMAATQEAIAKRKKMTALDELDEDMKGMIDEKKVKDINSEVKALEKSLAKLQKQLDKLTSKSNKSEKTEEVEEKEMVDEVSIDENAEDSPYKVKSKDRKYLSMPGMENFEEEERYDEEGNVDPNGMYDAGANYIGDEGKSMDKAEYDKDTMNESFVRMQKLAGLNENLDKLFYKYRGKIMDGNDNISYKTLKPTLEKDEEYKNLSYQEKQSLLKKLTNILHSEYN
jgi:uncharacterized coiled-coil protein SlyX